MINIFSIFVDGKELKMKGDLRRKIARIFRPKIYVKGIDTPLGNMLAASTKKGICMLLFDECKLQGRNFGKNVDVNKYKILNEENRIIKKLKRELSEYFAGKRKEFSVKLDLYGTDFQKKVWNKLREIPYGNTISYREEALMLNRPKSFKAIAYANGKNPVLILIPCHRVINSDGSLGRYSMGDKRKEAILRFENPELGEKIMKITRENEELFGPQYKLPSI